MKLTRLLSGTLVAALTTVLLIGATGSARAQLLFEENFNYTSGTNLVGQGGWAQTGTTTTNPIAIATPGLTYSGYASVIGNKVGTLATSGQDVNHVFTGQSSSVYT